MSISLFEAWGVRFELSSEEELPIFWLLGQKSKSKDTLLSQTLKVAEKKVSLVF